jgi:hypothetical protein
MAADNGASGNATPGTLGATVVLVAIALFLMVAFQTLQLLAERKNLADLVRAQEQTIQEAVKLRQRFNAVAGATASLAEQGDAGARAIIESMRRQGITVKPPEEKPAGTGAPENADTGAPEKK